MPVIRLRVLCGGDKEVVGWEDLKLVFEETLHPLNVVVLSSDFELVGNEIAHFAMDHGLETL